MKRAKPVETGGGHASGRTYGGESAEERLARQRRQFMDAGLELFGSVGYRATTVRMLCKHAGLIDRYFYKSFVDTEDLLAAVYSESIDRIEAKVVDAIAPALDARDPTHAVESGLDAFFEAFENSRAARVCWREVLGVSPRIDALYLKSNEHFAALLEQVARQILPSVTLPDDEARFIAIATVGAVVQSALFWLLSDYAAPRRVLVSATAGVFRGTVGALLAGEASRASTTKTKKAR